MCAELARVGYGILEDLPIMNSQVLYLKSGEIYWLGPNEVMRIQNRFHGERILLEEELNTASA